MKILAICALLSLACCKERPDDGHHHTRADNSSDNSSDGTVGHIERYDDTERGVTCYYINGSWNALSCVATGQTGQ